MPRILATASIIRFPVRPTMPLLNELIGTIRTVTHDLFATYHPERHYMRGPGPACRAKHGRSRAKALPARKSAA